MRHLQASINTRRLKRPFVIATGARTEQASVAITLSQGSYVGYGEAVGVSYRGETPETMMSEIEAVRGAIEAGADRMRLIQLLPPGGARAALDAALWDLEARRAGTTVAALCGLEGPVQPVVTAFTISLDDPDGMEAQARAASHRPLLKVKLGRRDGLDGARAAAVRRGAPDAVLVADANCGWTREDLPHHAHELAQLDFKLLEQPLPPDQDPLLDDFRSPLPLCGDESCQSMAELERAARRYDVINIKLDKCGGLTHALEMRARLKALGKGVFVGCMICGVRAIAPALILAQDADFVDVDGPVWLAEDIAPMELDAQGRLGPVPPGVWGGMGETLS
ncbi:dipeptide epimerase [Alkalicaulis satelles]|uniref:Dipeptide epimerase n=1 Tax=Alkalicaulis satelles TaxID=2609175 RepID=A0A5M6ZFV7_9PROT|nr:dipeptide epimerase [Alkalicaulis satelles]KAA5803636.1 dipeptide epimerase [Alkalicaulis satelles]